MNTSCPHCKAELNKKSLWTKTITQCGSCGKRACYGNFAQWLSVALIHLFCMFGLVALLAPYTNIYVIVTMAQLASLVAAVLIVRPVPHEINNWLVNYPNRVKRKI